jgi:hypothetical protein
VLVAPKHITPFASHKLRAARVPQHRVSGKMREEATKFDMLPGLEPLVCEREALEAL